MKRIYLSSKLNCKNKSKKIFTLVDNDEYEKLIKYNWHVSKGTKTRYAVTNVYSGKKKMLRMHRVILNCNSPFVVDHISGNGLDNRKCNLRICTQSENVKNRKSAENSSSKFLGVSKKIDIIKRGNKRYQYESWVAQIGFNGKNYNLGRHKKEENAAIVYNEKAIELFGEFARLNKI